MTRAHKVFAFGGVLALIYLLFLSSALSIPFVSPDATQAILPVIPWWILVSFGSYTLASLGWGLFTFRDCPDAYEELLREINDARKDLRASGVTVD